MTLVKGLLSLGEGAAGEAPERRGGVGGVGFVEEVFLEQRGKFGAKRKDRARPIRALSSIGLTALRDLRVRASD